MNLASFLIILALFHVSYSQEQCGLSDPSGGLIVGGEPTKKNQFPWLAVFFSTIKNSFFCSGSLITNKHILSAAHCLHPKGVIFPKRTDEFYVYLGKHNISARIERGSQINFPTHIRIHEDYSSDSDNFDGDLAMITLQNDVVFNIHVSPVCFWNENDQLYEIHGVVVGWGVSEKSGPDTPEQTPNMINVLVLSNEICFLAHHQLAHLSSTRTFCGAAAFNQGPCRGDSGGGFYVQHNRYWYIRGIVSSSIFRDDGSCEVSLPSIYTDVTKFKEWILKLIGSEKREEGTPETLKIISREMWNAKPPKPNIIYLELPNKRIMVSHTVTSECENENECSELIRNMQGNHMRMPSPNFNDIYCNFLIGGDGLIYEGRGWNVRGEHTVGSKGSHNDAVCVAFIGDFTNHPPKKSQIDAFFKLLNYGVATNKLASDYKINAQRDFHASLSPGNAFYDVIKTWQRYSKTV